MRLQKKLDNLSDFDTFLSLLKKNIIQPKIGSYGGRKFTVATYAGQASLNNFFQTFKRILSSEKDFSKFNVAEKILNKLKKVDRKGEKALKSATLWQKVLTYIKSEVGKQFFDRKSEILSLRLQVHANKLTLALEKISSIRQIFDTLT